MQEKCSANGKGAWPGCGILFVRRSGSRLMDPPMSMLVLFGINLRQAQLARLYSSGAAHPQDPKTLEKNTETKRLM